MGVTNVSSLRNEKLAESELIRRILSGEKELYEILVRRNNQKLYRIIRSYLADGAEVEDAMQNTYLKAYTNLDQFRLEASFSTWLIRIGINEAIARAKNKGRWRQLTSDEYALDQNNILQMPDKYELSPQDRMIRNESNQLLENAIDQLESGYRIVYIMKEVEEMTHPEIAQALGITVSNVKVRLHRAKDMLKEKLFELSNDKRIFEFGYSRCDRVTEFVMQNLPR
ncbi:MAG: RNA polymerase sigma factor [Cyclobacteriaceae bacterium]